MRPFVGYDSVCRRARLSSTDRIVARVVPLCQLLPALHVADGKAAGSSVKPTYDAVQPSYQRLCTAGLLSTTAADARTAVAVPAAPPCRRSRSDPRGPIGKRRRSRGRGGGGPGETPSRRSGMQSPSGWRPILRGRRSWCSWNSSSTTPADSPMPNCGRCNGGCRYGAHKRRPDLPRHSVKITPIPPAATNWRVAFGEF